MISLSERTFIVEAVLEAIANKATQKSACDVINLNERTFQRWYNGSQVKADMRPQIKHKTPVNKLTKEEYQAVLEYCNSDEYASLPPTQIVPRLADKQVYVASEATFYRILKQEQQLQHRGRSKAKKKNTKPTSYTATKPNQVWTWDISYLPTEVIGLHYYLYLYLDIYSRRIVGADVYSSENGDDASDLLQRSMWRERCIGQNLVLHSDNGAPMKSMTLREKMYDLGVVTSRSRPRVSNDNPYSEAIFKTLKYCPKWPENGFSSLTEARSWVDDFVVWYNSEHRHSGIRYVTPNERHEGKDTEILAKRKKLYQAAKMKNPERWSDNIRNWEFIDKVELNPEVKSQVA